MYIHYCFLPHHHVEEKKRKEKVILFYNQVKDKFHNQMFMVCKRFSEGHWHTIDPTLNQQEPDFNLAESYEEWRDVVVVHTPHKIVILRRQDCSADTLGKAGFVAYPGHAVRVCRSLTAAPRRQRSQH